MFNEAAPQGYTSTPRTPSSIQWAQIYNIVFALIAWFGLGLQSVLSWSKDENGGFFGLFISLNYFTILSNILIACVVTALAIDPRRDGKKWRWLRLGALVQIVITGLVYNLVLAPQYTPETAPTGWGLTSTNFLHVIVPTMAVVGWLIFGPRRRITNTVVFTILIIPIIWIIYTLIHGAFWPAAFPNSAVEGAFVSYPYSFINVDNLGYAMVTVNTIAIAAIGLVIGYIFMGLERLMSKPPADVEVVEEVVVETGTN